MLRMRPLPLLLLALLPMCASAADSTVAKKPLLVRDMVVLDRISEPALSSDGSMVVYSVGVTDYAANKRTTSLWIQDLKAHDAPPRRLLAEGMSGSSGTFSPDGKSVYFVSSKSGK